MKLGEAVTVRVMVAVSVRVPDVPVIVTVDVPSVAVALAARVKVLVLVAGLELKLAVTPLGNPEADKMTLPLKPFDGLIVIALVSLVPCTSVKLLGLAESAKVGDGLTVNAIEVVSLRLPDVPVTVTVAAPVVAVALAVRVNNVEELLGFGLNAAVTPAGKPEAEKLTVPLKPFAGVIEMVLLAVVPCTMVALVGLAESAKVGAGATVRVSVVV